MTKWTPEIVEKLANCVRKTRFYRVELRGHCVEEVTPEQPGFCASIRFAGRDTYIPINEYHPEEFQIYEKAPLKNWWEMLFIDQEIMDRLFPPYEKDK